jgi:predicted RNA-binding protein with PIN domain
MASRDAQPTRTPMPPQRIWIMDGHNMIFAIPGLERLQVSDRREEARAGLTDRLRRFAIARGEKVLVVFDGNQMLSNPDAVRSPLFEVVYSRRGEGVADDRIIHEARACSARGLAVTVVTDDVRTLAIELPRSVQRLGVRAFWRKHIDKEDRDADAHGGKRVEGDFSDVEREMLARDAAAKEREFRVGEPAAGTARPGGSGREPGAATTTMRDRILDKRDRGRLRQERRLKRRARPAGRR